MMQGRDALLSENQFFCCYHCVFSLFGRFPFWKRFFFCWQLSNVSDRHFLKGSFYGSFPCSRKLSTKAAEAGVPW